MVTIGCPKVWRSDRVFTILDGLLRDLDSITVKALQDLDPNEANAAELESLLTELQVSAKYDQAAAVTNAMALEKARAVRTADLDLFRRKQESNQILLSRRAILENELLTLQQQEFDLIKAGKSDPQLPELKAVREQQQVAQNQITQINTALATPSISDASGLGGTAAPAASEVKPKAALTPLPDELKKSFQELLKRPTLPATMRMDNVINLLHERLARQFAAMYDDLSRQADQYDLYLVQFDIGVMPGHDAKDRQLRVNMQFKGNTAVAYDLYPSASAYNTLRGMDKTSRIGLSGVAQTIFGFGLSVAYNRERNQLRSGLSQSLYISGFGAGTSSFGWLIGPAPFENFVYPGNRSVYAIVLVPKPGPESRLETIQMDFSYCWQRRESRHQFFWMSHDEGCEDASTTSMALNLPDFPKLRLTRLSYTPLEVKEVGAITAEEEAKITNTVQLTFKDAIDPNLTITAGDKVIGRVRDVRGRALYGATAEELAGNPSERAAVSASRFGFLEKDRLDPDTWLQVNSKTLLLNISLKTAGTDVFPVIRLSDPGTRGNELFNLLSDPQPPAKELPKVRIGEWQFEKDHLPSDENALPSAFLALFTRPYDPGRIKAYVDEADPAGNHPALLRIVSETIRPSREKPVWLHDHAQVVLEAKAGANQASPGPWALDCDQEEGTLLCKFPDKLPQNYQKFKVWVEEPPYFGRPGMWAETDVTKPDGQVEWRSQPYALGDWSDVRETCRDSCPSDDPWNSWVASIRLRGASNETWCLEELKGYRDDLKKYAARMDSLTRSTTAREGGSDWVRLVKDEKRRLMNLLTSPETKETGKCGSKQAQVDSEGDTITLQIPFEVLPLIPTAMHLCKATTRACKASDPERITLPDLRSKILPGPVIFTDMKNGYYRVEGEHLRAVDLVRLESATETVFAKTVVGYNNVDFFPGKLKPGTYNVFFVIGATTVPARKEDDHKQLQPVSFPVIEEEKKEEKKQENEVKTKKEAKQS